MTTINHEGYNPQQLRAFLRSIGWSRSIGQLEALASYLNDLNRVEEQWKLHGVMDRARGHRMDSDQSSDPHYGEHYDEGYDAAHAQNVDWSEFYVQR